VQETPTKESSVYYDRINKTSEVYRNAAGEVACGDSHWSLWSRKNPERPAATDAWIDTFYQGHKGHTVMFTCRKHSGIVKASITKRNYSARDVRRIDADVESVAANVEGYIDLTLASIKAEADAAQLARDQRNREYVRQGWDTKRAAHFNSDVVADFGRGKVGLSDLTDDDFGRVFVFANLGRLRPVEARRIAVDLIRLADDAEDLSKKAVKP